MPIEYASIAQVGDCPVDCIREHLSSSVSMAPHRSVLALGLCVFALAGCTSVSSISSLPSPAATEASIDTPSSAPASHVSTAEPSRFRLPRAATLFGRLREAKADNPKPLPDPATLVTAEDLIVVGYASVTAQPSTDAAERRLMAARASRLDAYRSMAELVFGVHFGSESAADDTRLRNDNTRTRVSGHLRGVEIVSIEPLGNDTYQTTLRLPAAEVMRLRAGSAGR